MTLSIRDFQWTREPAACTVCDDRVEIITRPHTDLWQRTYYHFRNDNAPVFRKHRPLSDSRIFVPHRGI